MNTIIKVNPNIETPPKVVRNRRLACRYAYARSADSRAEGDIGQDYITFYGTPTSISFVLCDGVSQSFFGNFAAEYIGNGLLKWVINLPPADDSDSYRNLLSEYLQFLTIDATRQIENVDIPAGISPMLLEVLEEKRDLGSESTFICGRIDLPSEEYPQGRAFFAWMGDSRLRIWNPDEAEAQGLKDTFRTEQRWSTKRGKVGGEPNILLSALRDTNRKFLLSRIMVYSDGLSELDSVSHSPSNYMLEDVINRMGTSSTSDDISFFEIWLGRIPENIGGKPTKQVSDIKLKKPPDESVSLSWKRFRGTPNYQIEVKKDEYRDYIDVSTTKWDSEELSPGNYSFRVRTQEEDGEPGIWSDPVFTNIIPPIGEIKKGGIQQAPSAIHQNTEEPIKRSPVRNLILVGSSLILTISILFVAAILLPDNFIQNLISNNSATETQKTIDLRETVQPSLTSTLEIISPTSSLTHTTTATETPSPFITSTIDWDNVEFP